MSDVSIGSSESITHTARVTWVIFLFIAVIFFVAQSDIYYSKKSAGIGVVPISVEDRTRKTAEGDLSRRIAFLSLGIFGVIGLMRNARNTLRITGALSWLIMFYLVWALYSIAWADDVALTFRRLVLLAILCVGALYLAKRLSVRDIILMTFSITAAYFFISITAEIVLGTIQVSFAPEYRFAGVFHPIYQGINCSLLLLASVALMKGTKRRRGFFLAIAVVAFIFLLLTKSRIPFASAMLALLFYWSSVLSRLRKFTLVLRVSMTFCLLILLVGDALFPSLQQVVLLGREDQSTYTLTGRIPLWKECLSYIAKRPFIGYGYGGFWTPKHIYEISVSHGWVPGSAHCAYIDLILALGLVGMVSYVLILVFGMRRSFVYHRTFPNSGYAFFGSLLGFCALLSLLSSDIVDPMLWTFLTMVVLAHLGFQHPYNYHYSTWTKNVEDKE